MKTFNSKKFGLRYFNSIVTAKQIKNAVVLRPKRSGTTILYSNTGHTALEEDPDVNYAERASSRAARYVLENMGVDGPTKEQQELFALRKNKGTGSWYYHPKEDILAHPPTLAHYYRLPVVMKFIKSPTLRGLGFSDKRGAEKTTIGALANRPDQIIARTTDKKGKPLQVTAGMYRTRAGKRWASSDDITDTEHKPYNVNLNIQIGRIHGLRSLLFRGALLNGAFNASDLEQNTKLFRSYCDQDIKPKAGKDGERVIEGVRSGAKRNNIQTAIQGVFSTLKWATDLSDVASVSQQKINQFLFNRMHRARFVACPCIKCARSTSPEHTLFDMQDHYRAMTSKDSLTRAAYAQGWPASEVEKMGVTPHSGYHSTEDASRVLEQAQRDIEISKDPDYVGHTFGDMESPGISSETIQAQVPSWLVEDVKDSAKERFTKTHAECNQRVNEGRQPCQTCQEIIADQGYDAYKGKFK